MMPYALCQDNPAATSSSMPGALYTRDFLSTSIGLLVRLQISNTSVGHLCEGKPLSWEDGQKHADYIREHGIIQFLNVWKRQKDRRDDEFLWGDELECIVISYDDDNKNARLSLRQSEILDAMNGANGERTPATEEFQPEYGQFMVESTPGSPRNSTLASLLAVEKDMEHRKQLVGSYLKPYEVMMTLTSYPRLGVQDVFTDPALDPVNATSSHSMFLAEGITAPHFRYRLLTENIRKRQGSKPMANIPIYVDENTPRPFNDPTIPWDRNVYPEDSEARDGAAKPDHIYLDALGFGASCCCLQVTFQASDINDARRIYDALTPIAPILMALTASSPAHRGYLSDIDSRWGVLAPIHDERTEEEKGLKPLKHSKYVIPKSRQSGVDMYISPELQNRDNYNNIPVPFNPDIFDRLRQDNVDDLLAKHLAHIFIRDPLYVFSNVRQISDIDSTEHFDSIQSTVWQSLRFKPPPSADSKIGWRVEVRTMDVQPTDFENAAFAVFVVLLARTIKTLGLEAAFYVPIDKVDENIERAQKRDAIRTERFWFAWMGRLSNVCEEMTIDEIVNGKDETFPGLVGLVNRYLDTLNNEPLERSKLEPYLDLVKMRADGSVDTPAMWIRNFVRTHPAYQFDSVLSQEINYDLIKALEQVAYGKRYAEFLPARVECDLVSRF
ncbi:hypothetical protein FRC08_002599 [Ceratobasidium sp. 394]|nr:hypothetical protein FRC08_002599 [Ceratobasidium sp. 394]